MFEKFRLPILFVVLIGIGGMLYYFTDWQPCCAQDATIPVPPAQTSAGAGLLTASTTPGIQSVAERSATKDALYPRAKELVDPTGFINTGGKPIKIADYIGKDVILIDFWTYSCINCIRTQPYLNAWERKYGDKGLLIIGVHTPEFDFEKVYNNVLAAVQKENIKYPVVLDSNDGTWNAYQNSYWPRKYLIDIDGYIVYDKIGEGGYDETEMAIQKTLQERANRIGGTVPTGIVNPTDTLTFSQGMPLTPETYIGAFRNADYLANGTPNIIGAQSFTLPAQLSADKLYLNGAWNIADQYAEAQPGASIDMVTHARNIYFVASAPNGADVNVIVDGKPIGASIRGSDVDANGIAHIKANRLYKIIEAPAWGQRTLELKVKNGTLEAFTFTFG